jgi:hypothetical protein
LQDSAQVAFVVSSDVAGTNWEATDRYKGRGERKIQEPKV